MARPNGAEPSAGPDARAPRFQIALIHNYQAARNDYLLPRLGELCAAIDAALSLHGWQPAVVPHSAVTTFRRDWKYLALELAWSDYRNLGPLNRLRIAKGFVLNKLPKYLLAGSRLNKARHMSFIETIVTAKHIGAWQHFLDSGEEYLICCEDDLVMKTDSTGRLLELIGSTGSGNTDALRYYDLAGGLALDELRLDGLITSQSADRIDFFPAVTNTACCYLLSRNLAGRLVEHVIHRPDLRLVGIDWMMNAIFIEMRRKQIDCAAAHFVPPIFGHGTFTGDYVSWQKSAGRVEPAPAARSPTAPSNSMSQHRWD